MSQVIGIDPGTATPSIVAWMDEGEILAGAPPSGRP